MNRWFISLVIITAIAGIFFVTMDVYPAINTGFPEEWKDITDINTERMLQELANTDKKRGMTGELKADLEKAQLFSLNKETTKARQERSEIKP